jgi:hypothetical protein
MTFDDLDKIASAMTDSQAAELLNRERKKLFALIHQHQAA